MTDDMERRNSQRASLMTEVEVEFGGRTLTTTALDISRTGLSVWAPEAAPGVDLVLRFEFEGSPLSIRGQVAREFHSDGGAVWGVAFLELDEQLEARFIDYVARNAA